MTINYLDRSSAAGCYTPITYDLMLKHSNENFQVLEAISNVIIVGPSGTLIGGTPTEKLGFWGTDPVEQPTTLVASATHVDNPAGNAVKDGSMWDGYTIPQVVRALRIVGILA